MVYIHLATGFEEVEALTVVDVLRRAEIDTKTISITGDKNVIGAHRIKVVADMLFEDADYSLCDMIVLPGGMPGATNLEAHEELAAQIKVFNEQGKYLAAICAAPLVFATHGVLKGKISTIYPGMEEYLKGAKPSGQNVTVDGKIITGIGPAIAMEFALELVKQLKGTDIRNKVAEGLLFERR